MVKYIKAFIKTVKQMDKENIYFFATLFFMIIVALSYPLSYFYETFFSIIALISIIIALVFTIVGAIDPFKELFEVFIEKFKKNI